ncbi:hypothetical protein [Bacillus sp. FSL R5-0677]|uniref:hypothetical protein n=1 Tax=Bacillus sp. FSL R5-0677 TaxID=2921581 RepID=UPI0030FC1C05
MKERFAFAGISPLKNERPTIKGLFVAVSRVNSKGVNNNTTKIFEVTNMERKNFPEFRAVSLKEMKRELKIPKSQNPINKKGYIYSY